SDPRLRNLHVAVSVDGALLVWSPLMESLAFQLRLGPHPFQFEERIYRDNSVRGRMRHGNTSTLPFSTLEESWQTRHVGRLVGETGPPGFSLSSFVSLSG